MLVALRPVVDVEVEDGREFPSKGRRQNRI